jgi:iron complex transport system ATP-binding protein
MTSSPAQAVIDIRDFCFQIGGKTVLRDVTFSVLRGEYLAIIGPNGAGKSTLLKCIDRILVGGSGRIEVCGRPLETYRQKDLARLVSYVPQADGRIFPFTVEQFVLMGRYPYLSPFSSVRRDDRDIVRRTLELTGTNEFADRQLNTLSGGERQKVLIAAALAQGAEVLLLDEPTTFLDYHHQAEIHALLARVNEESGVTIVAVTHDVNHAAMESDRIVAMRAGNVVFCGTPGELMHQGVLQRIYAVPLVLVDHPTTGLPMIVPGRGETVG